MPGLRAAPTHWRSVCPLTVRTSGVLAGRATGVLAGRATGVLARRATGVPGAIGPADALRTGSAISLTGITSLL